MTAITGVHPYADKFPMLGDDELAELAESIRENGQRQPIILTEDGLILDGRNRRRACEMAGVEPMVSVYDGHDLAEYVIDCNVTRRNMSTGARAMATALVLAHDGRRENGRWAYGQVDFADSQNASTYRSMVARCGVVLDFKPDLAEQVVAGAVTLNDAFGQAKAIKDSAERDKILAREKAKREREEAEAEAQRNAEAVANLTQAESKYLPMVEAGDMSPVAAWAAHRADHQKELDRQAAERRNDEEQARMICRVLASLEFLDYDNQREWCQRAMREHAEAVPERNKSFYTPEQIRHFGDMLHAFADEMESAR